ncbi:MBL fold metallo-hydrolase [Nonomuraea sp. NPDC046570]|uniref:MBL fold metallo-hydrolase n=1 Tax=Nonomuraea sp. NPDC046570 TaxID=3155255 RepID=UPI0033E4A7ED
MDDPGAMTPEAEALAGAEAVLITHQHFDHLDPDRLRAAAAENPSLAVYTCPGVARELPDLADRVAVVRDGDTFSVAGFQVKAVGEKHHHDGLLNEWGLRVLDSVLASEATGLGADIRRLSPGESVDL